MQYKNRTSSTHGPAAGPVHVDSDRRSRTRLRDLCDEVLASYRAASNRDLISEEERVQGHALLKSILPLARS